MADQIIKNRRMVRQRLDVTALHKTEELDATSTSDSVRLDIVAKKVSVQLAPGLTANIEGSVDGVNFFSIAAAATGLNTYGEAAGNHLVKWVRITRTAGSGKAVIVGV